MRTSTGLIAVLGLLPCWQNTVSGLPLTSTVTADSPSESTSASPTSAVVSTAVPSSTASPSAPVFNTTYPPKQPTCTSLLYCPGEILQTIQLAQIFPDQKTFVDKPARYPTDQIVASFKNLTQSGGSLTTGELIEWVEANFLGEGLDSKAVDIDDFKENPSFLQNVKDQYLRGWLKIVNGYWKTLARENLKTNTCSQCESTLITLNHTFVVPGGRFRENYYWDTFWILEGLLESEIYSLAKDTILNFMDEIATFGFIPNGARIYYLNRSQPPMFTQMLYLYVTKTKDTSILARALPMVEKELKWWETNRTSSVTSPFTKKIYNVAFYNVSNTAPRPEGYIEDYEVVWGDNAGADPTGFDATKRASLYADLASGAESGQDFSQTRWTREPTLNLTNNSPSLRTLNLRKQVPVDLNAILYRNYYVTSQMYKMKASTYSTKKSKAWAAKAEDRKAAILDLNWDNSRFGFYDLNLTAQAHAKDWTVASMYPYWSGIYPKSISENEDNAQKAFAGVTHITARYNGSVPTSLKDTGAQWDFPMSGKLDVVVLSDKWLMWFQRPPHVYITLKAFEGIPSAVAKRSLQSFTAKATKFSYVPSGYFGLKESDLPVQPSLDGDSNITTVPVFGTAGNLGNVEKNVNWRDGMVTAIANRYMSSVFCSWYATGGVHGLNQIYLSSIPNLLGQLDTASLNQTNSVGGTGQMFEKVNVLDLDAAGSGGEYTVQTGFGWTNGVALSFGSRYGGRLETPSCPDFAITGTATTSNISSSGGGAAPMIRLKTRGPSGRMPMKFL